MSSTSYFTLLAAIFNSLSFLWSIYLLQLQYSFKAIVTYQVFHSGNTMTSQHRRDYFLFYLTGSIPVYSELFFNTDKLLFFISI